MSIDRKNKTEYTEKEILHSAEEAGAGYGETTEKNETAKCIVCNADFGIAGLCHLRPDQISGDGAKENGSRSAGTDCAV